MKKKILCILLCLRIVSASLTARVVRCCEKKMRGNQMLYVNKRKANGNEWIWKIALTYCSRWPMLPAYCFTTHSNKHNNLSSTLVIVIVVFHCIGFGLLNKAKKINRKPANMLINYLFIFFLYIRASAHKHTLVRNQTDVCIEYTNKRARERETEWDRELKK